MTGACGAAAYTRQAIQEELPCKGRRTNPAAPPAEAGRVPPATRSPCSRPITGRSRTGSSSAKKAKKAERKQGLAEKICKALRVHTRVEEELFYPAFLAATQDTELHHEAEVEHAGAKRLIGEIETMSPANEYFDAKIKVLSEMIKHHVKEEEQPGGMFAEARKSNMDLDDLGRRMAMRKKELESNGSAGDQGLVRSLLSS